MITTLSIDDMDKVAYDEFIKVNPEYATSFMILIYPICWMAREDSYGICDLRGNVSIFTGVIRDSIEVNFRSIPADWWAQAGTTPDDLLEKKIREVVRHECRHTEQRAYAITNHYDWERICKEEHRIQRSLKDEDPQMKNLDRLGPMEKDAHNCALGYTTDLKYIFEKYYSDYKI